MFSKTIKEFAYHSPKTLSEALQLLAEFGDTAKPVLGGTDLVPKMKAHVVTPQHVIALKQLKELQILSFDEKDGLKIGAAVTLYDLEKFPVVKQYYPALYEGVHSIASTQIRNLGTLVGNACNAVPSADSCPALLVLDATATIRSTSGVRTVPMREFFTGVCKTVVKPDELVTQISIPSPTSGSHSIYYAHTIRRALDLAMVGSAANMTIEDGICTDIKIALGAVAATPRRAYHAEELLKGQTLTDELIEESAICASLQDCAPITDMRATAEYRRELVKVLTRNALRYCRDAQ